MTRNAQSEKENDERQLCILSKLVGLPGANLLELGFTATPQYLRTMAARGLVKITVTITPRGMAAIPALKEKAARRKMLIAKARTERAREAA